MRSLVTVYRKDPLFISYIDGSFSKTHRAIPLRSLNVNSDLEQVTFELIEIGKILRPHFLKYWSQIFKVRNFMMLAFPAVLIFIKNEIDETLFDPATAAYSLLGAFFLMAAANLRNDWVDHLSGVDRIHPQSGSQAIQKGWVTGRQVYRWSFFYLILGILCGLRAVILYPQVLIFVGALAVVGILGISSFKAGLKYRRWSEFAVFLLLGPFLTLGLQASMGNDFDLEALLIGVVTGWMSVFYLHVKNFQQMMVNEQAQFKNTLSWLGFERGKKFIFAWWIFLYPWILAYQYVYTDLFWFMTFALAGILTSLALYKSLKGIPSPLSSRVKKVVQIAKISLVILTSLILLEALYFSWIFEWA